MQRVGGTGLMRASAFALSCSSWSTAGRSTCCTANVACCAAMLHVQALQCCTLHVAIATVCCALHSAGWLHRHTHACAVVHVFMCKSPSHNLRGVEGPLGPLGPHVTIDLAVGLAALSGHKQTTLRNRRAPGKSGRAAATSSGVDAAESAAQMLAESRSATNCACKAAPPRRMPRYCARRRPRLWHPVARPPANDVTDCELLFGGCRCRLSAATSALRLGSHV